MSLAAGTRLGAYEILAPLGAGGMGEVYRARDTRLDRTVAIKVLPAAMAADPEARDRFDREARAISSLEHPHICALFDVGHQDGITFLVLQYLEGETLDARLQKGRCHFGQATQIAIEICDALDKAHRSGIVHRDLKPANVMLTKSGAKLLDFGLAKSAAPVVATSGLSMLPTTPPNLTAQGTILGTFQYMAPEQIEGTRGRRAHRHLCVRRTALRNDDGTPRVRGQDAREPARRDSEGRAAARVRPCSPSLRSHSIGSFRRVSRRIRTTAIRAHAICCAI